MVALAAGLLAWTNTGCGQGDETIRNYQEVMVISAPPQRPSSPHGSSRPAPAGPKGEAGGFAWQAPKGWAESPGSGMRLASFAIRHRDKEGLCTVVTLSGPAGGLESNVVRWLGQLELPVPEGAGLGAFLEAQDRFETDSGLPVVFVDLLPLSRNQASRPDSMLVGVIQLGRQTAFLKLTGPMDLLEKERENLRALCRSFRIRT